MIRTVNNILSMDNIIITETISLLIFS